MVSEGKEEPGNGMDSWVTNSWLMPLGSAVYLSRMWVNRMATTTRPATNDST